jgi:ArsR family transcriptional regulator
VFDEMNKRALRETSKILKAISERNRLRILKILELRPMAVCEIRDVLGLSMSTVSKHLAILREAEFIIDDKDGKWINYRLSDEKSPVRDALLELLSQLVDKDPIIKSDRKKALTADRLEICRKLKLKK